MYSVVQINLLRAKINEVSGANESTQSENKSTQKPKIGVYATLL